MSNKKSDVLLHPVRMRLVTELAGRHMTPGQLAAKMPDVAQATLYRHISRLVESGIFEVVSQQAVNGAVERTYGVVAGAERLTAAEMQAITPAEHGRYFSIFAAALINAVSRYVQQTDPDKISQSGLSYNRAIIYLSDEERAAFQDQIVALIGGVMSNEPTPERQRFTLASVVIPDEIEA